MHCNFILSKSLEICSRKDKYVVSIAKWQGYSSQLPATDDMERDRG